MKKNNKNKRMTETDLKNLLKNKNVKITEVKKENNIKKFEELLQEKKQEKNKKRSTIKTRIIETLKTANITIDASNKKGEEFIAIWFEGARALTLNEILNTIENRPYELFQYKKEWQRLINKSLLLLPHHKRVKFDSYCKVTLFRQGVKLVDLDGFQAMFKYAIDALRYAEVLEEDNPNIMFMTETIQKKGKPYTLGIKIEKIKEELKEEKDIYKDWFSIGTPVFNF